MSDWNPLLLDHWFVAALSRNVCAKPLQVVLFGKPIVLVRNDTGTVWAFEDRCPHRGAALSAGKLSALGLVCPYHGWTFGGAGRCTAMPGTETGRPLADVRVPAFNVIERDGMVWLSHGDRPLPQRVLAMNPKDNRFRWQTRWHAPVIEAQENFLDALHTHTVHTGLVRRNAARLPVEVVLTTSGDGFVIDYRGQPQQSGILYRLFESTRTAERAHLSGLSVAQIEYQYANGSAIWISLHFSPEGDRSTRVFITLHVAGRWAPRSLVRLLAWPFLRQVERQDKAMLEQQDAVSQFFPGRRFVVTPLDIARPYIEAAWRPGSQAPPAEAKCTLYL
jgi:phenylpropionate dioxygenase-like ring-hydroxylating dioxygenase large terminal subunit